MAKEQLELEEDMEELEEEVEDIDELELDELQEISDKSSKAQDILYKAKGIAFKNRNDKPYGRFVRIFTQHAYDYIRDDRHNRNRLEAKKQEEEFWKD